MLFCGEGREKGIDVIGDNKNPETFVLGGEVLKISSSKETLQILNVCVSAASS